MLARSASAISGAGISIRIIAGARNAWLTLSRATRPSVGPGAKSRTMAVAAPLAMAIRAMFTPATWKNGIAPSTTSPTAYERPGAPAARRKAAR